MDAQIKLLKTGWKAGLMFLVVISLVFGGLFLSLRNALAGNPNLTLLYLGVNNTNPVGWAHSVTLNHGEQVKFYAEIHNTNVPSTRSEERRVGKSVDLGGRRIIKKNRGNKRWNCDWSSDVCSSDLLGS